MDEITADRILLAYEEYEDRFLKFLKMVPYNGHNKNAWSPVLVDLLLGVCGLLDSTFREMMSVGPCCTSPEKTRRKDFNITHYKKQFATDLRLKCPRTLVLMTPPRIACPLKYGEAIVKVVLIGGRHITTSSRPTQKHEISNSGRHSQRSLWDVYNGGLVPSDVSNSSAQRLDRPGWPQPKNSP